MQRKTMKGIFIILAAAVIFSMYRLRGIYGVHAAQPQPLWQHGANHYPL
jgi:hypothetical protein